MDGNRAGICSLKTNWQRSCIAFERMTTFRTDPDVEAFIMPKISSGARKTYLRRRSEEIKKCLEALEMEDWQVIQRVGHKMKGNAETFGFERLTPIAVSLELAAQEKNTRKVIKLLTQLDKEVDALANASY
jgi:HPt (histidine-containing phosphotransfer) domain-containing protein